MDQTRTRRVLLAIAVAIAATGGPVRGANDTVMDARLTISTDLADAARRALLREAESIWRDAGVRIRWVTDSEASGSPRALRVLVIRDAAQQDQRENWVVGQLLRFDNGAVVAIASVGRAEAVVRAAGAGRSHVVPESIVQHRLGVVLGRAVAHEIGHYLLDSGVHASHGLMRATFQPREFADIRTGTFDVDAASQRLIHARRRAAEDAGAPVLLSRSSF